MTKDESGLNTIKAKMTFDELTYLANPNTAHPDIGFTQSTDGGSEHPLWTILNHKIPPAIPWRNVNGQIRVMIERAGTFLHNHKIPYSFYADALIRFKKSYLKNTNPKIILKITQNKNLNTQFIHDYVELIKLLQKLFNQNPTILKLTDLTTQKFDVCATGILNYCYMAQTIKEALTTKPQTEIIRLLTKAQTLNEFLNSIGTIIQKPFMTVLDKSDIVKKLQTEMHNRRQNQFNPDFNKYFNHKNTINKRGLELILNG
jgi:hypothetical protein